VCVGGVCVCLCLNSCVYICKYLLLHTRALACDDTHFFCCRYGDPIDPDGDMRAMKEMKVLCSFRHHHRTSRVTRHNQTLVKPNGLLILGVPVARDAVVWNAHRLYAT